MLSPSISNKKYFNLKNKAMCIKGLLIPILQYSMQTIIFDDETLKTWSTIILQPIKRLSNRLSNDLIHILFNIPLLKHTNAKSLLSTAFNRLINSPSPMFSFFSRRRADSTYFHPNSFPEKISFATKTLGLEK